MVLEVCSASPLTYHVQLRLSPTRNIENPCCAMEECQTVTRQNLSFLWHNIAELEYGPSQACRFKSGKLRSFDRS